MDNTWSCPQFAGKESEGHGKPHETALVSESGYRY